MYDLWIYVPTILCSVNVIARVPVAGRTERHELADDHDVRFVLQRERVQKHVHEVSAG